MAACQEPWTIIEPPPGIVDGLVHELGLSPLIARLVANRGIRTREECERFLAPSLDSFPSPFEVQDMDRAVDRLLTAIQRQETICVCGDYDLDGVSSTALLSSFFRHYFSDVRTFIPHRLSDGYGLEPSAIRRVIDSGAKLIVTCDNGSSAFEGIDLARKEGVDVIVTDHHSLPDQLPPAIAIVNPRRAGNPSLFKDLSGAGVAFFLALALRRKVREEQLSSSHPNLKRELDLVALGTIADVVSLTGLNRVLVCFGLAELRKRHRPGIQALLEATGLADAQAFGASTVAFKIAPILNAAGRLRHADLALRLLTTRDLVTARELSTLLSRLNKERQALESGIVEEISERMTSMSGRPSRRSHVFADKDWHIGVVGIAASRLVEMTSGPGFVLSMKDDRAMGSGRSVSGFDLVQALRECDDLLLRYGGHPMAAGVELMAEKLEAFAERFEEVARRRLRIEARHGQLNVDAKVDLDQLDLSVMEQIQRVGPFGAGNPVPLFVAERSHVIEQRVVGRGHLRLKVRQAERCCTGIAFRQAEMAPKISPNMPISFAFSPEINFWRGRRELQLRIVKLALPA